MRMFLVVDVKRGDVLRAVERAAIVQALDAHQGNVTHAAHALGIHRTSLQRKLKKQGLR